MSWKHELKEVALLLKQYQPAVCFTGAGVSVASGIPDFRSAGGLWERFDPFDYASLNSFFENPDRVWEMLRELYLSVGDKEPNAGHMALARLEAAGLLEAIITQNIDNLHQEAGSRHVIEFHGNGSQLECLDCRSTRAAETLSLAEPFTPPACEECEAIMKPTVIFFGEAIPPFALMESQKLIQRCGSLLVVGTSAEVEPARGLPLVAASRGVPVVEINLEPTFLTRAGICTYSLHGPQEEILPALADALGAS